MPPRPRCGGYADDRNAPDRRLQRANALDRLNAVDFPGSTMSTTASEAPCTKPRGRRLALADELGLVTELG